MQNDWLDRVALKARVEALEAENAALRTELDGYKGIVLDYVEHLENSRAEMDAANKRLQEQVEEDPVWFAPAGEVKWEIPAAGSWNISASNALWEFPTGAGQQFIMVDCTKSS